MKRILSIVLSCAGAGCQPEAVDESSVAYPLPVTTDSGLALQNLDRQIDAAERRFADRPDDPELGAGLVELRLLRSRMLGRFEELDEVVDVASEFPGAQPSEVRMRASVAAARHRFRDALSLRSSAEAAERAALEVALGDPDAALARVGAGDGLGPRLVRAAALSDLGMFAMADDDFVAALEGYGNVSPFIVGDIYFRRGVMWAEKAGRSDIGRQMYETGLSVLPEHVTMNVHLAEIEWEAGDVDRAVARLEASLDLTTDPEVPGLLGEILRAEGDVEAGDALVERAAARYEELLARHPEAFWDHGSEFFSGPGDDPQRGLRMALDNLENRPTERAFLVALSAAEAADDAPRLCELVDRLDGRRLHNVELAALWTRLRRERC